MRVTKFQVGLWATLITLAGVADLFHQGADGWDLACGVSYLVNAAVMITMICLDPGDSPPPAL